MNRLTESGTRRLTKEEALDAATELLGELRASQVSACRPEKTIDVLRELTVRRVVIEKLSHELTTRNVLPVTLNTLSNLLASIYICFL